MGGVPVGEVLRYESTPGRGRGTLMQAARRWPDRDTPTLPTHEATRYILADHEPLDPRIVPLQRTIGYIVAACISVGILPTALLLLGTERWAWCLVIWGMCTAGLAWFFHSWPPRAYRHASYRVDADGIEIRHGVLWRSVTSVPRSRVQHTDVVQGPLERRYGLGRLMIHTAGTEHSKVELGGLAHERALSLRDHLLPRDDADAL